MTTSPIIKRENKISPVPFSEALLALKFGKKITKLEWKNKEYYGLLREAKLQLHKPDNTFFDWIISEGDLLGNDWIIL